MRFAFLTALIPFLATPVVAKQHDPSAVEVEKRVVAVVDSMKDRTVGVRVGRSFGSGVLLDEWMVLTSAHVLQRPGKPRVRISGAPEAEATLLHVDRTHDFALLRLEQPTALTGRMKLLDQRKATSVQSGDWCIALGFPDRHSEHPAVRLGRVKRAGGAHTQTTCALGSGDSGGPLFDLNGRLIGIHRRISTESNTNIHVALEVTMQQAILAARDLVTESMRTHIPTSQSQ